MLGSNLYGFIETVKYGLIKEGNFAIALSKNG